MIKIRKWLEITLITIQFILIMLLGIEINNVLVHLSIKLMIVLLMILNQYVILKYGRLSKEEL